MRKFKFHLDAVLHIRKAHEDDTLRSLGAAQRKFNAEVENKTTLIQKLGEAFLRRESLGSTPTAISSFNTEQSFINGLKQKIIQADQAIFRARKNVEKCMHVYFQAKKESRMMEILREKSYQEYRKQVHKKEQERADDQMVMRANQRRDLFE